MTRLGSLTNFLPVLLLSTFLSTPAVSIPVCDGVCDGPDDCPDDCYSQPVCTTDTCSTCSRPALGVNDDYDAIPDQLEYDLAHAFFPAVMLKNVGSDLQQAYPYRGRAIPFMVTTVSPYGICNELDKCLEIRYGLAYFQDYGDWLFSGHLGDSEFYAVVVMRTQSWAVAQGGAESWQMVRDFTAAHWGTSVDSSIYGAYGYCPTTPCSNYTSSTLCEQQPACDWSSGYCTGFGSCYGIRFEGECYANGCEWVPAACRRAEPVICYSYQPLATYVTLYASEKKHALYHSDWECDHGGWIWPGGEGEDECPNTGLYSLRDFKSGRLQNVGNGFILTPDTTIQHPNNCDLYDVWGGAPFGESTSYRHHFYEVPLAWGLIQ